MSDTVTLNRSISPMHSRKLMRKATAAYGSDIHPIGITKSLDECMFTAHTPRGAVAYFWFNVPSLGNTTKSVHIKM